MKISFDTTEDVEHLKELHALIARLIEKKGSLENTPASPLPQEGMFAMFGQPQELPKEDTPKNDFRVIEY